MTICPCICEIDSSTLSRIGCEKVTVMPGITDRLCSISARICFLLKPRVQSLSSRITTRHSSWLATLGSVPSSGRPSLEIMLSTSGVLMTISRNRCACCCDSEIDTLGSSATFNHTEPSFNSGKNSEPSREPASTAIKSPPAAIASTELRCDSAHFNAGA